MGQGWLANYLAFFRGECRLCDSMGGLALRLGWLGDTAPTCANTWNTLLKVMRSLSKVVREVDLDRFRVPTEQLSISHRTVTSKSP